LKTPRKVSVWLSSALIEVVQSRCPVIKSQIIISFMAWKGLIAEWYANQGINFYVANPSSPLLYLYQRMRKKLVAIKGI
jgi:hypothetical protein